jgi:hypothetical protein
MGDAVLYFKKRSHTELTPGREFTAFLDYAKTKKKRLRFKYARPTAKGWELTGWDGRMIRTVPADGLLEVHRTSRISGGHSAPPPSRRSGRR